MAGASERKVIQKNGTLRGGGGVKLYFKRNQGRVKPFLHSGLGKCVQLPH